MKKLIKIISLVLALALAAAALVSCGKKDVEEPDVPDGPLSGGWQFSDKSVSDVTDEEKAVFDKALEELVGATHVPKSVIATQLVAGTNYAYLCISTPVVPNATSYWSIVTVYKDLGGNVELIGIEEIDGANVKITSGGAGEMTGAWSVRAKDKGISVSDAVDSALENHVGVNIVPVAVLATQVVAGTNYRILACGTVVSAEPVSYLYVIDVYASLDGKAEITSIGIFDLVSYIYPPVE